MNNLVLITSVINTPQNPLSYSKIRSVFNREERFNDTKETIKSIKENIPNCKIMIVECSDFSEEENDFFCKNCDFILNLWEIKDIHNNIFGMSKSLGEGTMTIYALNYIIHNKINYDNLFKISGRYYLSENFNYNNFENNNLIFKKIDGNINNIFTALYKVPHNYTKILRDFLINNANLMYKYVGFEILFGFFLKNINYKDTIFYDTIGLKGKVTVCGTVYNG